MANGIMSLLQTPHKRPSNFLTVPKEKTLPFDMRVPNALTAETLAKSDRGENVHHAIDADDLFRRLGI
jgi:DNA-damage-inducible protein J